eukprot:8867345-Lingulodinium_polyedra.AAC.1
MVKGPCVPALQASALPPLGAVATLIEEDGGGGRERAGTPERAGQPQHAACGVLQDDRNELAMGGRDEVGRLAHCG